MADNKKSFLMYADWLHTIEGLTDTEAGILMKHLFRYVNDLNPICTDRIVAIAFEPIKHQLKRDLTKWDNTRTKRTESGKLGGIKSGEARRSNLKQTEANEASASNSKQTEANEAVTVNDNVTVNVNVTKEKRVAFAPPHLEEVELFFEEKGFSKELAHRAFEYYSVNDWKDSKGNKVKNWKQKMISVWLKPENLKPPDKQHPDRFSHNQSEVDKAKHELRILDQNEATRTN